jgi:predicted subunit of tRNA(5-methylaminomethyl-2-thiouridylate) methyltransferase
METDFIYAILAGLAVLFFLKKNKAAEAEAENLKTKEKLLEVQKEIVKTEAALEIEEKKRDNLKNELERKTNEALTEQDIIDFFNRRK